jgi:leucyl/phenylalanyl-tRNA--protein transferase
VLISCAGRRRNRPPLTWITPRIMQLYSRLHAMGHAHSFEVWNSSGELVGGGYGLAVGRVFVTESMFSVEPNTSKIGLAALNHHLARWGFVANDGKDWSFPLEQAGMKLVPRAEYERLLARHAGADVHVGKWTVEADTAAAAA